MRLKKELRISFTLISILGTLFVLIELIMHLSHTSICHTEGCKLVSQYARFGDAFVLLTGFVVLGILALLSGINLSLKKDKLDTLIDLILILSLTCEGFLVGMQAFRIHKPCAFCLTVFSIFVILSILRILTGHKRVSTGFACFFCIFSLFYLILPASNSVCLPQDKLILFYGQGCSHCKKVLEECRQCNMRVCALPASVTKYQAFLNSLGIDEVPVLLVNNKREKKILVGETEIERYLTSLAVNKSIFSNSSNFLSSSPAKACKIGKGCR